MALHQVLWCLMTLATFLKPSGSAVRRRRDEEAYELPIAAGLMGVHPINPDMDYVPVQSPPTTALVQKEHLDNEPYFDVTMPRDITAFNSKSAYLTCRAYNVGNHTVSWIRHTDVHIVSVGTYTYISDKRFVVLHNRFSPDWTLHIKWVNMNDAGTYSCQLSTRPVKNYYIVLSVVGKMPSKSTYPEIWREKENNLQHRMLEDVADVPTAYIAGGKELFVSTGSTFNLSCILNASDSQIFWYHNDEIINYDSLRGGISIVVEKGNLTISTLHIKNTSIADTGNYTCSPSNANSANTIVHVIKGTTVPVTAGCSSNQQAAMHKGGAGEINIKALTMSVLTVITSNRPSVLPFISFAAMCYFVFFQ